MLHIAKSGYTISLHLLHIFSRTLKIQLAMVHHREFKIRGAGKQTHFLLPYHPSQCPTASLDKARVCPLLTRPRQQSKNPRGLPLAWHRKHTKPGVPQSSVSELSFPPVPFQSRVFQLSAVGVRKNTPLPQRC